MIKLELEWREVLEWKRDPTMPSYEEWRNQMLGGLRPSDWDRFKTSKQNDHELNELSKNYD